MHGDRQNDAVEQGQILQESHAYDDIIYLSRPVSLKHPPMDINNRAAQFSPFAALTGHSAAIEETARLTSQWLDMDEQSLAILDEKMQIIRHYLEIGSQPLQVTITYFMDDARKQGGSYVTECGTVKKIKDYEQLLVLQNGSSIAINRIVALECDVFAAYGL